MKKYVSPAPVGRHRGRGFFAERVSSSQRVPSRTLVSVDHATYKWRQAVRQAVVVQAHGIACES